MRLDKEAAYRERVISQDIVARAKQNVVNVACLLRLGGATLDGLFEAVNHLDKVCKESVLLFKKHKELGLFGHD